ncbi:MAG: 4-(cytidine 5'-diphospho)-2-C-methyl-D-erythritol kinase [Candidatus Zixiibacteriota bacterium]
MIYYNTMELNSNIKPEFAGHITQGRSEIFISAPAKINLFLKVTGRRPDGYHNIYSWFQAVDLADHLHICKLTKSEILIETNWPSIPTGSNNLVYKAAELIQRNFGRNLGFKINLFKQIPAGAGLGGGSSDAAAFIKGANKLIGLDMSNRDMEKLGLEIGSDIPFFFGTGQAEVSGRGEIVKPIQLPTDYRVILVTPDFEISAADAYRYLKLDLTGPNHNVNLTCCKTTGELFGMISQMTNDLEIELKKLYPIFGDIEERLIKFGARIARLSGSGPTIFSLFDKSAVEEEFALSFVGEGWGCFDVNPLILPLRDS